MQVASRRISEPYTRARGQLEALLAGCDVQLDGSRPWDLRVLEPQAVGRMLRQGSIGLGESYMDGQWECDRIDQLICRLLGGVAAKEVGRRSVNHALSLFARLWNLQSRARAWMVGGRHYDAGNDLFEAMLDPYMNYSCGYWQRASSLEEAQQDKMELICRKLQLEPGMKVLDVGCGWGGLARFAAEHFGVQVVGITISREQHNWACEHLQRLPVEIRLQDYRDLDGTFDRVFSIGMFEHVGYKNYRTFFRICHDRLREGGLMLLQTIGANDRPHAMDPWIHRYIFPNGSLPSVGQIGRAIQGLFLLEDLHSFGAYYDRTLMAWHRRVNEAWNRLGSRYGTQFRRMWNFYLLICAGAFRASHIQLWQLVLGKGQLPDCYQRPVLDHESAPG